MLDSLPDAALPYPGHLERQAQRSPDKRSASGTLLPDAALYSLSLGCALNRQAHIRGNQLG